MIRIWRIVRVFWAMLTYTIALSLRVRRLPADERDRYRAQRQLVGCRLLCRILGIRVDVEGTLPEKDGMLVVSNHFGVVDPIILASAIPAAFVGKAELRRWPFIGWVAITHGMLLVERERLAAVTDFKEDVRRHLAEGVNVLVFPEGTTSPDLELLPFKTGAFEAVAERQAWILPVYLAVDRVEGEPAVGDVRKRVVWSDPNLPFLKHTWEVAGLESVHTTVRIGEPIPTEGRTRKELAQLSRAAVQRLRDREETIHT